MTAWPEKTIYDDYGTIDCQKLFNNLMWLDEQPPSGFYYRDHEVDGKVFRIFLYRITSAQWWRVPGALYSRGTVYQLVGDQWRLVSLCMPKFFNVGETDPDLSVQWSEVENGDVDYLYVTEKHDGSLISVFEDFQGDIQVKSKGSFTSDQAIAARKLVEDEDFLETNLTGGITLNYEYVAPDNFIVVRYSKPELKLLNATYRDHVITTVPYFDISTEVDVDEIMAVPEWEGREGVVAYLKDDKRMAFKLKSRWYFDLHAIRSEITSAPKIAKAILEESLDDIRSAFPEFTDWFDAVEHHVTTEWNEFWYTYNQKLHYIQSMVTDTGDERQVRKARAMTAKQICDHYGDERDKLLFSRLMADLNGGRVDENRPKQIFADRAESIVIPDQIQKAEV